MIRAQDSWTCIVILTCLALLVPGTTLLAQAGGEAPASASAEDGLDAASIEALTKTQELLTTPALRDGAVQKNQGAQLVDTQVKSLGGNSANVDSIYGLSSDIFEDLVKETHGDPVKLQEFLTRAKDDPKGFAEHLSEKNKRALRDVAGKIGGAPTLTPGAARAVGSVAPGTASATVLPASNASIINIDVHDKK